MNNLDFVQNIPATKLAEIFKEFFEQHMVAYGVLKNVEFVSLNEVSIDKASITYSVKLLNTKDKDRLVEQLQSNTSSLVMYGKPYSPEVFMNGDLLCITIKK